MFNSVLQLLFSLVTLSQLSLLLPLPVSFFFAFFESRLSSILSLFQTDFEAACLLLCC